MRLLCELFEAACSGHGAVAMLSGEAGIGKTSLTRAFARSVRTQGAVVIFGRCFEGEWEPPFGPWAEALGEYVHFADPLRLSKQLGTGGPPLARLVPGLREAVPGISQATMLSPDQERIRLYDAVSQFLLSAATDCPLVVVLDDLQWADRESLRLLRHVARIVEGSRILLIGAYRAPDLDVDGRDTLFDTLALLRREADYHSILLKGLGVSEVGSYLDLTAGEPLPKRLARAIHEETSGNPFYVREVLRHLVEEGELRRRGARLPQRFTVRDLGVPEGVSLVVGRRLARLPLTTRTVLTVASGFASSFEFPVLRILTQLSEDDLLNSIEEAEDAGFIRSNKEPSPSYSFVHAIVRHTIYQQMNPDRRTRLHRRIAEALEKVYAGRETDRAGELAAQYHASLGAPDAGKGIPYALVAAEQARAGYALEGAVDYLRMARALAGKSPDARLHVILPRLAIAEAEALLLEDARRTADDVMKLAAWEDGWSPLDAARFLATVTRALKDGGAEPEVWEPLLKLGLRHVGDQDDLTWARLTMLHDRFEPGSSDGLASGRWLGHDPRAVAILRDRGNEDDYSRTLDSPDHPTRQETEAILAMAGTWNTPSAVMWALDVGARDLFYRHGAFRQASGRYEELLEASERYGSVPEQAEALGQLSVLRAILGDLGGALSVAQRAEEMILRLGPAHGLRFVQTGMTSILAYQLDIDWPKVAVVAGAFAASPELANPPHPTRVGLAASAIAAIAHQRLGNQEESRRYLEVITPAVENMECTTFAHNSVVSIASTAVWDLGAADFASTYSSLARRLMSAGVGSGPLGPHELIIGRMACLLGEIDEGLDWFERARNEATRLGLAPCLAVIDYDEALALSRAGLVDATRTSSLLQRSADAFRALGMVNWEKRALDLTPRTDLRGESGRLEQKRRSNSSGQDVRRTAYAPDSLTPREKEVVDLIARGQTNAEIAAQLVVSLRTAEAHVNHILSKLGLRSRTQVATWAMEERAREKESPTARQGLRRVDAPGGGR